MAQDETRVDEIAPNVYRLSNYIARFNLQPKSLAVMHGSSFAKDCAGALRNLAVVLRQVYGRSG